jgi:hypothetical protein
MIKTSSKQTSRRIPGTHPKRSSIEHEARSRTETGSPTNCLRQVLLLTLLVLIMSASSGVASAQLNIPVIRGDNGLKSGSQGPPGVYLTGIVYFYDTHEIVDANGTRFNRVGIEQGFAAAALTYIAKKKILGGNYSATVVLPLLNVAIDTPQSDSGSGVGYSDTYVQPIQLGWHKKRYDTLAGFGIFMPTGKFTPGGSNNHGLGMWSYEFSAGATVYLDEKKQWHAATNAYYNIQSHIKDTNRKAGNVLSLEGGVGRTFCSGLCNAGVDYYTQWKVTDDTLPNVPPNFISKHRYYGLGPEVNGVIPINAKTMAIFKVAYFHEFGNRVATQGQSVIMSVTLMKPSH